MGWFISSTSTTTTTTWKVVFASFGVIKGGKKSSEDSSVGWSEGASVDTWELSRFLVVGDGLFQLLLHIGAVCALWRERREVSVHQRQVLVGEE